MPLRIPGVLRDLEYLCQAVVLFVVVVSSIYNLSSVKDSNQPLWASLLSVCVGLCVPGPTVAALRRQASDDGFDDIDSTEQQQYPSIPQQCDLGLSGPAASSDEIDRRTI